MLKYTIALLLIIVAQIQANRDVVEEKLRQLKAEKEREKRTNNYLGLNTMLHFSILLTY